MTEVSTKKTRVKKFLKWMLVRLPLVIVIAAAMMIATLKLVERYPQELRAGFEEFLSDSSDTNALIGTLDHISFIPNFDILIENLTMHNRGNAAIVVLEAALVEIGAPIWSMFFGGTRLDKLKIDDLKSEAGFMSPKSIFLDDVNIIDKEGPEQYGSFVIANGLYDGKKLHIEIEIEKFKKGYSVPKSFPFSIHLGHSELNASLVKKFSEVWLETVVFSRLGKESLAHDYILVESSAYNKENPLSCLLYHADSKKCDMYLEEKDTP